jgi:hypothetical protein
MRKAVITDKGSTVFIEGKGISLTIGDEKNIEEVDLSNLSSKEFEKLKKEKDPKKIKKKLRL